MARPEASRYQAALLYEEARLRRSQGNTTGAMARYSRLFEMADELNDPAWKADLCGEVGEMSRETYEVSNARTWYTRALALFRELGDRLREQWAIHRLAQVEQLDGSPEALLAAEAGFRDAITLAKQIGDPVAEAAGRAALGLLLWDLRQERAGAVEVLRALASFTAQGEETARTALLRDLDERRQRSGPVRFRTNFRAALEELATELSPEQVEQIRSLVLGESTFGGMRVA